mgnify:CR=1 FL=1
MTHVAKQDKIQLYCLHETQFKYKDRERLLVKVRKEVNQTHNKNNKDGLPSLKYYGAVVLIETEVQLQSISTVSNFMSSVKSAIV